MNKKAKKSQSSIKTPAVTQFKVAGKDLIRTKDVINSKDCSEETRPHSARQPKSTSREFEQCVKINPRPKSAEIFRKTRFNEGSMKTTINRSQTSKGDIFDTKHFPQCIDHDSAVPGAENQDNMEEVYDDESDEAEALSDHMEYDEEHQVRKITL